VSTVFVVMVSTGQYDDKDTWAVCATTRKECALEIIAEMDALATELGVSGRQRTAPITTKDGEAIAATFHKRFGVSADDVWREPDYAGYDFDYFEVEVRP